MDRFLGLLTIIDIRQRAEPADDFSVIVLLGTHSAKEPAVIAARVGETKLDIAAFNRRRAARPPCRDVGALVGMNGCEPLLAKRILLRDASVLLPLRVEIIEASLGV